MAGQLILSIETSTGCGSVSLTEGGLDTGHVLAEITTQPKKTHSRRLLGSIQQMVDNLELSWQDIHAVAVSLGPGSFTGLRIGMAAAKGIAMGLNIPLLGVPTLDALACQCLIPERIVYPVLDARKAQVYAAGYRVSSTTPSVDSASTGGLAADTANTIIPLNRGLFLQRICPFQVYYPQELLDVAKEYARQETDSTPVFFAGPGAQVYAELFGEEKNICLLPGTAVQPRASSLGFLATMQLSRPERAHPASLAPLYIRASEAEINAKIKSEQASFSRGGQ